jgi:hypothetical protein
MTLDQFRTWFSGFTEGYTAHARGDVFLTIGVIAMRMEEIEDDPNLDMDAELDALMDSEASQRMRSGPEWDRI